MENNTGAEVPQMTLDPCMLAMMNDIKQQSYVLAQLQERFFQFIIAQQSKPNSGISSKATQQPYPDEESVVLVSIRNQLLQARQLIERQNQEKLMLVKAVKELKKRNNKKPVIRADAYSQTFPSQMCLHKPSASITSTESVSYSDTELTKVLKEKDKKVQFEKFMSSLFQKNAVYSPLPTLDRGRAQGISSGHPYQTAQKKSMSSLHNIPDGITNSIPNLHQCEDKASTELTPPDTSTMDKENMDENIIKIQQRVSIPKLHLGLDILGQKPIDVFRNFQESRLSARAQYDDSPQALTSHRQTLNHDKEIYSADYWQKKVDSLIREKKNILKVNQTSHLEIRRANEANQKLMVMLRDKDRQIEQLQIEGVLLRRGCHSQMETRFQADETLRVDSKVVKRQMRDRVFTALDIHKKSQYASPNYPIYEQESDSGTSVAPNDIYENFTQEFELGKVNESDPDDIPSIQKSPTSQPGDEASVKRRPVSRISDGEFVIEKWKPKRLIVNLHPEHETDHLTDQTNSCIDIETEKVANSASAIVRKAGKENNLPRQQMPLGATNGPHCKAQSQALKKKKNYNMPYRTLQH